MADYADGPDLDVYENSPFAREHYTDQLISELADIAGITDTDKLGREIRIWAGLHHKIFRNVTEETRHATVRAIVAALLVFFTMALALTLLVGVYGARRSLNLPRPPRT